MNLKILYNNYARDGYLAGWGFSCLIQEDEHKILFDTGWNGNILIHNMKIADVSPEQIDKIVISHSHWDHIGGLNHILKYEQRTEVYVPESISNNLKKEIKRYADIIEISNPKELCENIWTTGELGDEIKEQSLVMLTEEGNLVLTGCAHPGLESIVEKSREFGEIYGVIGGFHDSDIDVLNKIPLLIPCHCTKKLGEIKKKMSEYYQPCEVGFCLSIEDD